MTGIVALISIVAALLAYCAALFKWGRKCTDCGSRLTITSRYEESTDTSHPNVMHCSVLRTCLSCGHSQYEHWKYTLPAIMPLPPM